MAGEAGRGSALSAVHRARAEVLDDVPPLGDEWPAFSRALATVHPDAGSTPRVLLLDAGTVGSPHRVVRIGGRPVADLVVEPVDGPAAGLAVEHAEQVEQVIDLLADLAALALAPRAAAQEGAARLLAEHTSLLEHVNDAVLARDLDGRLTYWNPRAEATYGWRAPEVLGRDLDDVLRTEFPDGVDRLVINEALLARGVWEGELSHARSDGRRLVVHSRKALLREPDGTPFGVLTINSDITERRATEEALVVSEELFRSQFEHSAVGQGTRSVDGTVESVNPALVRMLGYPDRGALLADPARRLREMPDEILEITERLLAGTAASGSTEVELERSDGRLLSVLYTTSLVRDRDGSPLRFVSHLIDLTQIREAEAGRDLAEQALRERLDDLDAMNRLKTDLIGMLGHELKNPLTVLSVAAEMADAGWGEDATPAQRAFLDLVQRSTARLSATVGGVLSQMASETGRLTACPEPVAVVEAVREALAVIDLADARVLDPDGVSALVQPEHLVQIVANLASNALKYAGGVEQVVLAQTGDVVVVDVVDAGPGVPADFRASLFGRFSRAADTAGSVEGTGLGLYLVRELARANGGDALHLQRPGGGAIFRVLLPAVPPV